ncbi:UDP-forming cellulose synthase catalytic subunit [Silvibacterium sp.]|uniref:UDP-forming cellulose synthase catalytic subunit n=1 Tax=Silvibacterium sp. TaxID=1964179 RepID=UPI0039E48292
MASPDVWQKVENSESFLPTLIRATLLLLGLICMFYFGIVPLTWPQQAVMGLLTILLALWLTRVSNAYLITLALMVMSLFSTFRYAWWRIGTVIDFFQDPGSKWGPLDAFFIFVLVGAETYAFIILFLGFMQTIWPLRRAPVPLPEDPNDWPHVDLLIPSYNEPLNVVRYTALAALNIDWPADKLHVYILDDGKREEFRRFAEEAGVGYMTRTDNKHAKAGNINRALQKLTSPYVAIFDCDHVPTRSFMQMTMGWFLRDHNLAMLQTPHHFYSPDPFERNLHQFRTIPNEGELFYGIVQDGNDFWNATFFCGSCAVLRRTALDEIGGIAVETVTEDAHTSLRMQMNGWNTAYINIPQAAGLATERLSGHVKQRIRWARGMIQILRTDNPLFAKGLNFAQRLCYFNAMTHFMYALPRLIFLTSPLIYLLLSHTNVPGYWAAIFAYALPHLVLSNVTNSRVQGQHRHSFWNEIYETVLSPYILLPTMMALVNPKLGKFDVTAKGGVVKQDFFDHRIAQPFIVLMLFNFLGLLMTIPRFFHVPGLGYFWDGTHPGTIIMNGIWTIFNIVILSVATAVARESRQQRQQVRITFTVPVRIKISDSVSFAGETIDASSGGAAIHMKEDCQLATGQHIRIAFPLRLGDAELPAIVISSEKNALRLQFDELSLVEEELLTMILYSRADTWLNWGESREVDQPLRSLWRILQLSRIGIRETLSILKPKRKQSVKAAGKGSMVAKKVASILLFPLLLGAAMHLHAQPASHAADTSAAASGGEFHNHFTLGELGMSSPVEMRGIDSTFTLPFALQQNQIVKTATLHMVYHFSPGLIPAMSHIKVMLNGTLVGTVEPPATPAQGDAILDQTFTLPADLLVRNNQISFEFIGHYVMVCEDPANTVLWSRVDPTSTLDINGELLPLADDLKFLPLPFFDDALKQAPVVPIAFLSNPTQDALQAAGIVASYFGVQANSRPVRFPTSVGTLPSGNVVLVSDNPSSLPAGFNLGALSGPTLAVRPNPADPYGKVLIVAGADAKQLIIAAQALSLGWNGIQGATVTVHDFTPPAQRIPDDAPRWARTDHRISLSDYTSPDQMKTDGSAPIETFFRTPPDLYYADKNNTILHVDYRYNPIPIGPNSSVQVQVNHAYLGSLPLIPGKTPTKSTSTTMALPVVDLRPFSDTMSFIYTFQVQKAGGCKDTTPINMQGSILGSSYLDLRGFAHWAAMPNLDLFASAGFPFTRYADLSETEVVLPQTPSAQEIEVYLTMMGHFGAQTGFPVLRVTVGDADDMKSGVDRDFLVIGTGDDNPGMSRGEKNMPVLMSANGLSVHDTEGFFAPLHKAWWKIRQIDQQVSGEINITGLPQAVVEGFESPWTKKRSVVLVALRDPGEAEPFLARFLKVAQSSEITGTVSVLHGSAFQSYRLGNAVYHVGYLPWWQALNLWFTEMPWTVALAVFAVSFVFAVWIRTWLRRRARERLQVYQ